MKVPNMDVMKMYALGAMVRANISSTHQYCHWNWKKREWQYVYKFSGRLGDCHDYAFGTLGSLKEYVRGQLRDNHAPMFFGDMRVQTDSMFIVEFDDDNEKNAKGVGELKL